jgi:SulP family sulfate permease
MLANIDITTIKHALIPSITLATLLSIDTLKTCVAIDSLTRSRHNSNREIVGQGFGNLVCAIIGGLPGAGTMGATLINVTSGGRTPLAGLFNGIFVLLTLLFLGPFLAWIPVASLAGILLVIAFRMYDRSMFRLLLHPSGRFDFVVIISVVIVALTFDLIAASGVGIAMAIILFIRDQIRESVILQKTNLSLMSSKTQRPELEKNLIKKYGAQAVICKLQGNLFFGTTDQFSRTLEDELKTATYLLLDMRRVHSLDYTAFHLLDQIHGQLAERNGHLLFSGMPSQLYEKRDFERYLSQMGLFSQNREILIFDTFDSALEWMEEKILSQQNVIPVNPDQTLGLKDFYLFHGFIQNDLESLEHCMTKKTVLKGSLIVRHGDLGDELFLVRKGSFRALLPLASGKHHHIATFEQGSFFGELAFLDRDRRSADIEAKSDSEVYIFSRARFNELSISFPEVGAQVFARLALAIAQRLRTTDSELRALEDR